MRWGCKILNTMTALGIPDGEMIGCPAGGVTGDSQPSMELCTKAAARYDGSLSVTIEAGRPYRFIARVRNSSAALRSRRCVTTPSTTSPA